MKNRNSIFSFQDGLEVFGFSFLSGLYGVILLILFIRFNFWNIDDALTGESNKPILFKTYLLSWFIFPFLGIGLTLLLKKIKMVQDNHQEASFHSAFIFLNFLYLAFLLRPTPMDFSQLHGCRFLLIFLLMNVVAIYFFKKVKADGSAFAGFLGYRFLFSRFDQPFYGLVVLTASVWFLVFNFNRSLLDPTEWGVGNFLTFFLVIFAFYFGIPSTEKTVLKDQVSKSEVLLKIAKKMLSYFLAFLMIFLLVCDANFKFLESHYAYYLGPVADMLGGKALLSNINAQYGVFVFYFLKACFSYLPIGMTSFCLLVNILQVLQYFLLYFIARQIFRGEIIPFFSVLIAILFNHFAQESYFSYVPSTGFLRFGFLYILMSLILMRNRYPNLKNVFLILESFVAGVSFFWGFEVCFYTVPSYLAFMVYESMKIQKPIQFDLKQFGKRVLAFAAAVLFIAFYIYSDVYLKTYGWPHWNYYFDYISLYKNGFGMKGINQGGYYWWIVVAVFYFSFFSIFAIGLNKFQFEKEAPRELNAIFFLTVFGVFQFFYFLGRSESNNLLHVSVPAILLVIYWLSLLKNCDTSSVPGLFKRSAYFLMVVMIGVYIFPLVPIAENKIKEQWMSVPEMFERIRLASEDIPKNDRYAVRVSKLMKKYSGDEKSLVYFFGDEDLNVSIYAGRINMYPYNDVDQAAICPAVVNRIIVFSPDLKPGDYVYYDLNEIKNSLNPNIKYKSSFEEYLLDGIERTFRFEVVEKDRSIVVIKLGKRKL